MSWRAVALGDSCLVHRRGGEVLDAFPLDSHESFTSTPWLVPSSESVRETALARLVGREGGAEPGDTFLLMTDALSAWYFETSARRDPRAEQFDSLLAASENGSLAELVRRERAAARLKDDDVAVVRVTLNYER
jgi:hypothetical protein